MPADDGRNEDPEIIQDFKVFWDDSFKETFNDTLESSHYKRVDVGKLSGGVIIQGGYSAASGLGGEVQITAGQGGCEVPSGGEVKIIGGQGKSVSFAQGEDRVTATLGLEAAPSTSVAIGYNAEAVAIDSFAFGAANKAYVDKTILDVVLETSAVYHGSFTAGYSIYGDILNTIETTCQEDDLDLLVEEGQEKLFGIETFFTIEGEEQVVSDWRDSWLSYIGNLED
jgi:hypothetical protein